MACNQPSCAFCHGGDVKKYSEYSVSFLRAFKDLIENEGIRYTNDPDDPGGETKYGISKRAYPHLNIRDLTLEDAREIYWVDYWSVVRAQEIHYSVAFEIFDMAVNHGPTRAIILLQDAVDVANDGSFGPLTMKAYRSMELNDVLLRVNAFRLKFYTKLSKWPKYGRGWTNRVADNLLRASKNN